MLFRSPVDLARQNVRNFDRLSPERKLLYALMLNMLGTFDRKFVTLLFNLENPDAKRATAQEVAYGIGGQVFQVAQCIEHYARCWTMPSAFPKTRKAMAEMEARLKDGYALAAMMMADTAYAQSKPFRETLLWAQSVDERVEIVYRQQAHRTPTPTKRECLEALLLESRRLILSISLMCNVRVRKWCLFESLTD